MMNNYDQHVVIKTLDNPLRILFWNLSDFFMLVIPFFLGVIFESVVIVLIGLVLRLFFKRLLQRYPQTYFKSLLYWYLPTKTLNRILKCNLPPSHFRLVAF